MRLPTLVLSWLSPLVAIMTSAAADLGTLGPYALRDVDGRPHTAADREGAEAVVYCLLGTECPVSNGYAPAMQRLAEKYAPRGVRFIGVYCEPEVTAEVARRHGEEYGLKFPRLLDPAHELIGRTGAKTMPTMVVVGPSGAIAYRGRIDDRWSPQGKRRDAPRTRELEDALEAVLAGRAPTVSETPTFGCPLPRPRAEGNGGARE